MEAQVERRYNSYSFMTSAQDGVNGQRHAPAALYPRGKDPCYPLDRRLGGPQSCSGHRDIANNPLPLPGIEPGRPVRSQTLYWLNYPVSHSFDYTWRKYSEKQSQILNNILYWYCYGVVLHNASHTLLPLLTYCAFSWVLFSPHLPTRALGQIPAETPPANPGEKRREMAVNVCRRSISVIPQGTFNMP
jgi:hypothetical protein